MNRLWVVLALAQPPRTGDSSRVTLDRIFASSDFATDRTGGLQWLPRSSAYTAFEPSAHGGGDLVRYDAATGGRTVVAPAETLVPAGGSQELPIEGYRGVQLVDGRAHAAPRHQLGARLAPEHARRLLGVRPRHWRGRRP